MKHSRMALVAVVALMAAGALAYGATKVPLLQEPPKPRVDRITDADDDLLPVKPRAGKPEDELLPVEPRKPGDGSKPGDAARPKKPLSGKAGKHESPGVNASFAFDLVVGYLALVPEGGMRQSYYLLDSAHGHIGPDRGAIEGMANMSASSSEGTFDFQVMTNAGDFYGYATGREAGRIVTRFDAGMGASGRDFEAFAAGDWFESSFKPTGKVRDIGMSLSNRGYRSAEYAGIEPESGTPMKLWLADPDFEVDFYAASYMGLGIVPLPKAGVQKLVTRMEGAGATFELSYVMRRRQAFSGAGYKDMSRYMPGMGGLPGGVPGIPGKK